MVCCIRIKFRPHSKQITHFLSTFLFSSGQGFDGLAKISVSLHKPSSTFIVVKQTDVDFQSSQQLEDLKVGTVFLCAGKT